jgi:hypothetical protein
LFWVFSSFGVAGNIWMLSAGALEMGTGLFALEILIFWSPTAVFLGIVRPQAGRVARISQQGAFAPVIKRIVDKSGTQRLTELGFEAGGTFVVLSSWDTLPGEEPEEAMATAMYHRSDVQQYLVLEDLPGSLRRSLKPEV